MPKKNELRRVTITDINNLGCGVGRIDGCVTFVDGGCTGDELEVKIIKTASAYCVGRIERIITPSPYRIAPGCAASKRCGGCVYRNITYAHELELKRGYVQAAMKKAGVDVEVGEVLTTGVTEGYRNKAQYPVGVLRVKGQPVRTVVGFYAERTHEIIPCDNCLLQPPLFGEITEFLREWMDEHRLPPYDEESHTGLVRHLYLRAAEMTGEVMVCIVATARDKRLDALASALAERFPQAVSVWLNINSARTNVVLGREFLLLSGREKIVDSLCGREFEISPASFYQVNRAAAEMLYNKAAELAAIQPGERVLDLFCGIGTVGMCVCESDADLHGVEIVPEAVENARANAARNGFANAAFTCCDAGDPDAVGRVLTQLDADGLDVVILDPPRKGCAPSLLAQLAALRTLKRIVYISCNPDTLARDLALMSAQGFACARVTPVDLFPRTGHVETVCLLSKLNAKQHIEINLDMDELDLTDAEKKATYQEIKDYVLEHSGLKVSSLYIAQVKQKCGIIERENYNKPKSEDAKQPGCPPDKEKAIKEALQHFGMI
ncbi:MAG: 23S rRNA (uracil(1939)-C(5))-methyltransferase RlmD [Clostridia bacterium]|nr:23S rRNA (uracil(1939)-C(5))-methyltransferase RlmD [Clostridia bacterium]